MSAESFLSSVVEAAIGLGGFAGIIAALRQRGVHDWPPIQRLILQMLLIAVAAAVAFALAPAVLREAEVPEPVTWRLCSGTLFVWHVGLMLLRRPQIEATGESHIFPRILMIWVSITVGLQAINLYLAESWPYLIGVFGLLVNGFTFFLILLLGDAKLKGDAADE